MAHFAKLDEDGLVLEVHVLNNEVVNNLPFPESEPVGVQFYIEWSGGYSNWKQTSYNNNFRKRYAGIGCTYDAGRDAFITPQPYPSWALDENADWQAPVPVPTDGKMYSWNEDTLSWVETTFPV
jgi:hypothetical protein